jgi:replication factor A1
MTGQTWLNAFNEAGEVLFGGRPALDMLEWKEGDPTRYQAAIKTATFQRFVFRLRIKNELYQGESKMRASILSLTKPDYARESKMLLDWLATVC